MQGVGVDTTRKHLARGGLHGVVGAGQTGDRVEENHDVVSALDHAFGLVEHHLGHFHVARGLLVESRGHDLGLGVAGHFGHLLGAFVDQQYDDVNLGVVVGDGVDDRLHEHRLTRLGLGYDQCALALADGGKEVHDARGHVVVAVAREAEFLAGEERCHEFELHAVADVFRGQTVDFVHAHQREVFLALLRGTDRAVHRVAGLQSEELDLRGRNVDVVRGIEVVVVCRAEKSVAVGHDLQHAFAFDLPCEVVLGDDLLLDVPGSVFRVDLLRGGGSRLLHRLHFLYLGLAAPALGFGLHRLRRGRFGLRCSRCGFRFGSRRRLGLHREFRFCRGLRLRGCVFVLGQPRTASARGLDLRCRGLRDCFLHRLCGGFRNLPFRFVLIFRGSLLRGVRSGDFLYQFALFNHDVLNTQHFGYFTQLGKAFPFQRFQILHSLFPLNVIFRNRTVALFVGIRMQR